MIVGQFRRLYNGPVGMGTLGGVYDIGINKDALTGREISAHPLPVSCPRSTSTARG